MIEVIYNYGAGLLQLHPDMFFPATSGDIRRLYKLFFRIGSMGASHYVNECLQHIEERIPEQAEHTKELANEYFRLKTRQTEMKQHVKYRKKASGVPFRGNELKEYKKELKALNEKVREGKADAERAVKILKKLEDNKKLLMKLDNR